MLKFICLFSLVLGMHEHQAFAEKNFNLSEQWQACKEDSDCVFVYDACSAVKSINKRDKDEYVRNAQEARKTTMCDKYGNRSLEPKILTVRCEKSKCKLEKENVVEYRSSLLFDERVVLCSRDTDCLSIRDVCGDERLLEKSRQKEFETVKKQALATKKWQNYCSLHPPSKVNKDLDVRCLQSMCALVPSK